MEMRGGPNNYFREKLSDIVKDTRKLAEKKRPDLSKLKKVQIDAKTVIYSKDPRSAEEIRKDFLAKLEHAELMRKKYGDGKGKHGKTNSELPSEGLPD